jgi:DNA modification methylase
VTGTRDLGLLHTPETDSVGTPEPAVGRLGVFSDNRIRPIHRWYPFVEGYSSELVVRALRLTDWRAPTIFDPFGGSGTTALAAALEGFDSFYCEVNPYLAWVAQVKVNRAREAAGHPNLSALLALSERLERGLGPSRVSPNHPLLQADERRSFFPIGVARDAASLIRWIRENLRGPVKDLALLACTTSLIPASNMIRRTDLRRRRPDDPKPIAFGRLVIERLRMIHADVQSTGTQLRGTATRIGVDVRRLRQAPHPFDVIVTSPPYLNGTNYCRNTKLELLALELLSQEGDLASLRTDSITAGINNVSARNVEPRTMPCVEAVARILDDVAYDQRIPQLVRMYFSDMRRAFGAIRRNTKVGARMLLDIGDSRFAKVHVPTHELLVEIASLERWRLESTEILRKRKSYDGSDLTQVLLDLRAV